MTSDTDMIAQYQELRNEIRNCLFCRLNHEQLKAVETGEGAVLCLAGAGSGKTTAMVHRILHLYLFGAKYKKNIFPPADMTEADLEEMRDWLEENKEGAKSQLSSNLIRLIRINGVSPYAILAITFTNKAANEMKIRLDNLLGTISKNMWVMTFHAMCVRILHYEIKKLGFTNEFAIYDSQDQLTLIKGIVKELNIDDKKFKPKSFQNAISRFKCNLKTPKQVTPSDYFEEKCVEVYEIYQERLKTNNALDFDDLLMMTVRLFKDNPEILEKYQDRFRYIMVDEYQDTNHVQYVLVNDLAKKYENLCVVGDDDQSIYGFRQADIQNILDFERDYPQAQVIKLEQNYRSTSIILKAANQVISNNMGRKNKTLWTENPEGEPLIHYDASDEGAESAFIAERVQELRGKGASYSDFAVLIRTNAQSRSMEEWFIRTGIPYKLVGGVKFYERKEIKDILAYLKFLYNPSDGIGMRRIINEPRRGIGDATVKKFEDYSREKGISIYQALLEREELGLGAKTIRAVEGFINLIEGFRQSVESMSVTQLTEEILDKTGYFEQLKMEKTIEAQTRIENLQEFLTKTQEYDRVAEENSLGDFLGQVALVTDLDNLGETDEAVVVMTMHMAKGLEFPNVFVAGMEEGIFPNARVLYSESELEEERRLFYVAITRAKERLYLINAKKRTLYGNTNENLPSQFLKEIPAELMEEYKMPGFFETTRTVPSTSINASSNGSKHEGDNEWNHIGEQQLKQSQGQIFVLGDKILHQKWGEGVIVGVKGQGSDMELKIAFPGKGIKTVMTKYAPIKKV